MTGDRGLTVEQAADKIGMSVAWVYRAAADGRLPSFKAGNRLRFRAEALEAWMKDREQARITMHAKADAAGASIVELRPIEGGG
jgi:excisionase family DNA binding protein